MDRDRMLECLSELEALFVKYEIEIVPDVRGDAYIKFTAKASLDLKCPVDYDKLVRAIEVVRIESQY